MFCIPNFIHCCENCLKNIISKSKIVIIFKLIHYLNKYKVIIATFFIFISIFHNNNYYFYFINNVELQKKYQGQIKII